jgi:hypothetical protein
MTGDQPGKGEVVLAALRFLGVASVHHALNPFPQVDRDERFVLALD